MSTEGIVRGYDFMDASSIDEHVICAICAHPFIDPVVTPCDHTFCKTCIKSWFDKKSECYLCRKGGLSMKALRPANHCMMNILDKILVRCLACEDENIRRGDFADHLENHCLYHPQKCSASDLKCPWVGLRNQAKSHHSACVFETLRPAFEDILTRLHTIEKENKSLRSENNDLKEELMTLEREFNELEGVIKNNEEHGHSRRTGKNVSKSKKSSDYAPELRDKHHHMFSSDDDKDETTRNINTHLPATHEGNANASHKHS
ncbi:unnamed protein product [Rotaria socialis]|uniref:RING-type domain-containing protein n=1 Tax=Rotaria socialis TaxID=392032 RepID=A0A817QCD8_9BILA|nr:unnamed protein product [Rotaria socialis]